MSEDRNTVSELFSSVLCVLVVFFGVYIALPSAKTIYTIQTSYDWPQVTGQVISSTLERHWFAHADDLAQDYRARIWFSYRVKGRVFVSDNFRFAQPWTKLLQSTEDTVAKYPPAKEVEVYYDPNDPQMAVVDRRAIPPMECVNFGVGISLAITGIISMMSIVFRDYSE